MTQRRLLWIMDWKSCNCTVILD